MEIFKFLLFSLYDLLYFFRTSFYIINNFFHLLDFFLNFMFKVLQSNKFLVDGLIFDRVKNEPRIFQYISPEDLSGNFHGVTFRYMLNNFLQNLDFFFNYFSRLVKRVHKVPQTSQSTYS